MAVCNFFNKCKLGHGLTVSLLEKLNKIYVVLYNRHVPYTVFEALYIFYIKKYMNFVLKDD